MGGYSQLSADLKEEILSGAGHKMLCTPGEIDKTACLNGGICFAVSEGDSNRVQCMCPSDWIGTRCEESYIAIYHFKQREDMMMTPYVLTVVSVITCFLLLLFFVMLIWILKEKQKRNKWENPEVGHTNQIYRDNTENPNKCVLVYKEDNRQSIVSCDPDAPNYDYGSHK